MEHNFLENELIILTKQTIDVFLEDKDYTDLLALYTFYYYTAKWQKTNQIKCTTSYVANEIHWGEQKVRNIKKKLIDYGLIEDCDKRDEQGKVVGHYIKMNYIFKQAKTTLAISPSVVKNHSVDFNTPNALSNNIINALSDNNKEIYKESFSLSDLLEKIKMLYKKCGYSKKFYLTPTRVKLNSLFTSKQKSRYLYPLQVYLAYNSYLAEKYKSGTEVDYITQSNYFISKGYIYDYAEKIDEIFREQMLKKYGEEWEKIKFKVVE